MSPLGALFITSPQVGAAPGCVRSWREPSSVAPRGFFPPLHPAQLDFLGSYVFFRVSMFFFLFCLMDFLFLIQLKGSEIHALD